MRETEPQLEILYYQVENTVPGIGYIQLSYLPKGPHKNAQT